MRIAFLGTPEFAVPSLETLVRDGHEIEVFTQPDRPKGRGYALELPPVKKKALELGLHVRQFERIRRKEGVEALKEFAPELMVTAAFGQILSKENLDIPTHGCINVHGSLLPRLRGAAPIQCAIINGDKKTGVTTMMTDVGLDTGDILMMRETDIGADETYGELYERLAVMGGELLHDTISALIGGTLTRTAQNNAEATKCGVISKEDARIDFSLPSQRIHDLVRGLNPTPGAFTALDGKIVKIWSTRIVDGDFDGAAGECIVADPKRGLIVKTGDGALEITQLQLQGSKRMEAKAMLNGKKLKGCVFG